VSECHNYEKCNVRSVVSSSKLVTGNNADDAYSMQSAPRSTNFTDGFSVVRKKSGRNREKFPSLTILFLPQTTRLP
jgi:hypothetical protein